MDNIRVKCVLVGNATNAYKKHLWPTMMTCPPQVGWSVYATNWDDSLVIKSVTCAGGYWETYSDRTPKRVPPYLILHLDTL